MGLARIRDVAFCFAWLLTCSARAMPAPERFQVMSQYSPDGSFGFSVSASRCGEIAQTVRVGPDVTLTVQGVDACSFVARPSTRLAPGEYCAGVDRTGIEAVRPCFTVTGEAATLRDAKVTLELVDAYSRRDSVSCGPCNGEVAMACTRATRELQVRFAVEGASKEAAAAYAFYAVAFNEGEVPRTPEPFEAFLMHTEMIEPWVLPQGEAGRPCVQVLARTFDESVPKPIGSACLEAVLPYTEPANYAYYCDDAFRARWCAENAVDCAPGSMLAGCYRYDDVCNPKPDASIAQAVDAAAADASLRDARVHDASSSETERKSEGCNVGAPGGYAWLPLLLALRRRRKLSA